jgi:hypothetical protein
MYLDKPRTMFDAIRLLGHEMDFEPLLLGKPTKAKPGSEAKVLILRQRLEAGEEMHHPDDEMMSAPISEQGVFSSALCQARNARTEANRLKKAGDNWIAARDAKKRKVNASAKSRR